MIMYKLVCLNINPQRLQLTVQLIQSTESTDILGLYLRITIEWKTHVYNMTLGIFILNTRELIM